MVIPEQIFEDPHKKWISMVTLLLLEGFALEMAREWVNGNDSGP